MTALIIIYFRIVAIAVMGIFVLPKQFKESLVSNGIGKVRKTIFIAELSYFLLLIGMFFNFVFMAEWHMNDPAMNIFLFDSIANFVIVISLFILYNFDYKKFE